MPGRRVAYEKPYTLAVGKVAGDRLSRRTTGGLELRNAPSRQLMWFLRRVAELDPVWGNALDELGVTMEQIRWVASPGPRERLAETEGRYRSMKAFLEHWQLPPKQRPDRPDFASFRALRDAHSRFNPVSGDEIPVAPPPVPAPA